MKRIFLNISLLLIPLLFFAQKTVTVAIDWAALQSQKSVKGLEVNYYSFDGAVNHIEYGSLPLYQTEIKLPGNLFECEIDFLYQDVKVLSDEESAILTDADLILNEIQYSIDYRDKTARLFVLPFMLNDSGKLIMFNTFDILIDFVPVEAKAAAFADSTVYTDQSVLINGNWFKLGIEKTGVHKITYSDLAQMGIDPAQLDTKKIGIFGNYAGMLPEDNGKERPDDLLENSIFISGDEDGSFDEEDYILFNATSAHTWKYNIFTGRFDHSNNLYADTVFYFLTTDQGTNKRISSVNSTNDDPSEIVTKLYDYDAHDRDLVNLIYSGKEWFGEHMNGDTLQRTFSFDFPNLMTDRPAYINFEIAARAFINTYFKVYINDQVVIDSVRLSKVSSNSSIYATSASRRKTFFSDSDKLVVRVEYLTEDPNAFAWINYIELNVERELKFTGGQMGFRDPHVSAAGNVTRFEIDDAIGNLSVWDVSDAHNPVIINFEQEEEILHFTLPTEVQKDFVVFDETDYFTHVSSEKINNQNLHGISGVDFVIISPDLFYDQAERLADIHRQHDGMIIEIVTPEQVYNEFSSGSQDISAIRDFMRMLKKKNGFRDMAGYLLLFGDASYDYKYRVHENTNFVPTYQSDESLRLTASFVTDDYFGLIDDNEGANSSGELDIGIGRFPVTNPEQAKSAVDRVAHYLSKDEKVMRSWRNNICFVADDGDKNLHLSQAKLLISITDTLHPGININKIFSDAHPKISVPGGKRFPKVNEKIIKQVDNGALIINYTGHGGLTGWSLEQILDVPTIRAFENIDNMPLFITATCEFSRYDDPEFVSAGEYVFLNENGAGIALLTTTRLAYAHANIIVNQRIYNHLMEREDGQRPRLGDLVRLAKIPSSTNFLNFVLLGDPALRLAYPEYEVVTTTINNQGLDKEADTVHALSHVTLDGQIVDQDGNSIQDFNGYVYPKVFDKASKYMTLGTEHNSYPEEFLLVDKVLFEGQASVVDGKFSFSFVVPKDIAYNYDFGKVSYYAVDTSRFVDAWGAYESLYIGGFDETAEPDHDGPEISLYLDDRNFISGDKTSGSPLLLADIRDENGVNFTGHSLGRDITSVMDQDMGNSMVMNEYFSLDVDSYQSGNLSYYLSNLEQGWHTLTLKAWDLQNNSSEELIDFYVDDASEILLSQVFNFPNPFTDMTNFGFVHNKNGTQLEVEIKIYDINGRYIGYIQEKTTSAGSGIVPLQWNGRDHNGNQVPPGLYSYHLIVTDIYGNRTIQRQKMIKMND